MAFLVVNAQVITQDSSHFYFAYGSNMNQERMQGRDIRSIDVFPGWIDGYGLRFNKRSVKDEHLGCANIIFAPQERVQGLLYQLETASEINKLDFFEARPFDTVESCLMCKLKGVCKQLGSILLILELLITN